MVWSNVFFYVYTNEHKFLTTLQVGVSIFLVRGLVFLHAENRRSETSYFPHVSAATRKAFDGTCRATSPCRRRRWEQRSFTRLSFPEEEEGVISSYLSSVTWCSSC